MNSFHFNFKTGTSVNPLELVKRFYINPNMIDGFRQLNLSTLCEGTTVDIVIINELPCVVIDISVLNLEQAFIKYSDDGRGGIIKSGRKTIYFKFTSHADCIRFDTVLFSSGYPVV